MASSTFNDVLARLTATTSGITFFPGGAFVSYGDLGALVRGNAKRFAGLGVRRGDRVAIALETDLDHVVTFLALMAMGAVPVSVKPRRGDVDEHARRLASLFRRYGIRHAHARTHAALPAGAEVTPIAWDASATSDDRGAIADASPEDVAFVQFSSGSLGDPKAVPIRHASLMANLEAILAVDGRTPSYVGYNFLPLSHDMGLVGGLLSNLVAENTLYLSTTHAFLKRPTGFFAERKPGERVGTAMPDFGLRYLVRYLAARGDRPAPALLAGVHTVYCGAEPIRRATIGSLVEASDRYGFDPRALVFAYGLAEATLLVTSRRFGSMADSFDADARASANVGRAPPGTTVRIGAGDGATAAAEGTIFVRGPSVIRGYLDGEPIPDGWHDTGDIGFVRDGDLYVSGRAKEVVIINGENVFPADIEDVVARCDGVSESLVMTEDDRFYVLVVPKGGGAPDKDAIAAKIGEAFGAVPSGVELGATSSILRTTSGKPMRAATLAALRSRGALA